MKRLFTFGCSFTEYGWPTWADLLSTNYDYYENWGMRGLGNRAIAERLAECHTRNKLTPDDTVIIQWSSHLRHDWFNLNSFPEGRNPGWKTAGSIFSPLNSMVFTPDWVEKFFHEVAYVFHTLNNIKLAQELLKNTGCTWYMTSIGDLRNLGGDINMNQVLGEKMPGTLSKQNNFVINERYPEFSIYVNELWDNNSNRWLEPLHCFANTHSEYEWYFLDEAGEKYPESHPSVTQYGLWVKDQLANRLSISDKVLQNIDKIVTIVEEMKTKSNHRVLDFAKLMNKEDFGYFTLIEKNKLKGYPL